MTSPTSFQSAVPLLVILLLSVAMPLAVELSAINANGGPGFPLDDPWIHLQFARNLLDFGSFSYYNGEMVTSGSTSPLYTFLLAGGFIFTRNEFILSYMLGILFFAAGGFFLFSLARADGDGDWILPAAAALLMVLEPRLVWASLSGMETTMFIALLLAVMYFYNTRKTLSLGVSAGLLLWARPEAVIFLGILLVDLVYHSFVVRPNAEKTKTLNDDPRSVAWMRKPLLIALGFAAAYAVFNLILSGSLLPNTFSAKRAYYSGGGANFTNQVFHFVVDGHMISLAVLAGISIIALFLDLFRRRPTKHLISFLWPLLMFLAYLKNLPYLYQEGRYLMPILPFVILLAIGGVRTLLNLGMRVLPRRGTKRILVGVQLCLVALLGVQFGFASWEKGTDYADSCKYISERQVRTARWLDAHLPEDAIVATHDIGAIAFYGGRRVVDMVGLVSPGMIANIGRLDKLQEFLVSERVTHLAVLRTWFEVVNQNPIFQTDVQHPEIMEVFPFDAAVTHFTPRNAGQMTQTGMYYLSTGNVQQAGPILQHAVRLDPGSSRAHFLLGRALIAVGRFDEAEGELRTALRLHPHLYDVPMAFAEIALRKNKPDDAIVHLEGLLNDNANFAGAYRLLAEVYRTYRKDTSKADEYQQFYNQLMATKDE